MPIASTSSMSGAAMESQNPYKPASQAGKHWAEKIANGVGPEPWKGTTEWAVRRADEEKKLKALLAAKGIQYILPWNKPENHCPVIGNTNKVLFLQIMHQHFLGNASIKIDPNPFNGFVGINSVHIPNDKRPAFNTDIIPVRALASSSHSSLTKKTTVKIWRTAGFVENETEDGSLNLIFDQALYDHMKKKANESMDKRRMKPDAASSAAMGLVQLSAVPTIPVVGASSADPNDGRVASGGIPVSVLVESVPDMPSEEEQARKRARIATAREKVDRATRDYNMAKVVFERARQNLDLARVEFGQAMQQP